MTPSMPQNISRSTYVSRGTTDDEGEGHSCLRNGEIFARGEGGDYYCEGGSITFTILYCAM